MIHPHTKLCQVHPDIGLGVVASAPIARGTIVWVLDSLDRVLTPHDIKHLESTCAIDLDRYTWQDHDGNAILCWDHARYVNHSCDPNCLATDWGVEVAVRDIARGEEITNDYSNLGMRSHEQFHCLCGAESCRGMVVAADSVDLLQAWRSRVVSVLAEVVRVAQPLWPLVSGDIRRAMLGVREH